MLQFAQVALQLGDAPHDAPTIDFQLGLATTETTAHTAALLREVGLGAAAQARQAVAQQGQLDLRLAFQGVRVLGEDVEDDGSSIERRTTEHLLQVVLLRRAQLVVEHHGVGVDGQAHVAQLLHLALADVPGVIGRVATLHHAAGFVGAGRVDEQ